MARESCVDLKGEAHKKKITKLSRTHITEQKGIKQKKRDGKNRLLLEDRLFPTKRAHGDFCEEEKSYEKRERDARRRVVL